MKGAPWKLRIAPHLGIHSPNAPLFPNCAPIDPVSQIRFAAEQGFAGMEDNWLKERPPDEQERIGRELGRCGLEMGCFVFSSPQSMRSVMWGEDEGAQARLRHDLARTLEAAKRVNGRHVVITGGLRDPRVPVDYQLAAMTGSLKRIAERFESAGLTLCVEACAEMRSPGSLLTRLSDAYRMIRAIDSPAVKLVFDVVHVQCSEGSIIENLARVFGSIAVVQVGDVPGRLEIGSGEINFENIFRLLVQRGFGGLVELEHSITRPTRESEARVLAKLREMNAVL